MAAIHCDSHYHCQRSFQDSSSFLCSLICVRPVQKPHCWFSHEVAHLFENINCYGLLILRYLLFQVVEAAVAVDTEVVVMVVTVVTEVVAAVVTVVAAAVAAEEEVVVMVEVEMEGKYYMSCNARKPVFGVSDQVRHKPICTVTEDG